MRRFVLGDVHGRFQALLDVLEASNFDSENDQLICLGDICDGGPDTMGVVEVLLQIKNLKFIVGNHDLWFKDYIFGRDSKEMWVQQGGKATLTSYGAKLQGASQITDQRRFYKVPTIPRTHKDFFRHATTYYYEVDNMVFVHGGFTPGKPIYNQGMLHLMWDRELIQYARSHVIPNYKEVFVGHSTTLVYGITDPVHFNNLWVLDTGAGHCGRLTIMDVDTKEYWQSDIQPGAK